LKFTDGTTSQGNLPAAQTNQAELDQNDADVTAQLVVNPVPSRDSCNSTARLLADEVMSGVAGNVS